MTLLLGPVLRHVDDTTALVWVQTERAAAVSVLGCEARTFEVRGHHFALVRVTGLQPDSTTEYQVALDGEQVWPPPVHAFPPSVIRTRGPGSAHRLRAVFGSCRYPKTGDRKLDAALGLDALDCYAARMATRPVHDWPDALILLGDQVYADELTPDARRRLAGRRSAKHGSRPPDEVVSFTEYERLYRASWSDPEIRWIMSTVPTAMIFDDHDVRDDWNTSAAWRAQMTGESWWPERLRSGLASYWVYQHLGNLSPAELDADEHYREVLAETGDCWPLLVEMADLADREQSAAKGVRFSFRWDLGRSRLLMVDSRNGRMLESGQRMMVGDREFKWVSEQARDGVDGLDHLVFGSSLPWLLPYVISDVQSVNELAAEKPGWRGRLGEKIRQGADLEHWAAFRESFDRLTELLRRLAGAGPATISVLSGDVHHSYAARATLTQGDSSSATVHQLVCSPVHNEVPAFLRQVFRLGWSRRLGWLTRAWARARGSAPLAVRWRNVCGPMFGNTIATLVIDGRTAEVLFEQPTDSVTLAEAGRVSLNG
ncbi:alkaline phosphatase D family protein [Pseudonocardia spinosispora]|uniref:alkaline phosphatase D family protein n=1 Tax=Pseudonocardia spinosispora TaxID=103441 RepID=UPI0003F6A8D2|nr:alkaline phosphatase D family protein [Pseudonocardia spinosispora]